jgi:hypothetical protein
MTTVSESLSFSSYFGCGCELHAFLFPFNAIFLVVLVMNSLMARFLLLLGSSYSNFLLAYALLPSVVL